MIKEIILYETSTGKVPVKEFLDSLDINTFQKVIWTFELLKSQKRVSTEYLKKLKNSDDIWEVRIKKGSNAYRIFCFFDNNELVVLTNGLIKKTQKTPKKDIERAEKYKRDYFERKK